MDAGGESTRSRGSRDGYRSHLLPRTREGWIALVLFLGLMAMAQPPVVHTWANRIEPWLFGVPFLYGYLLAVYLALIGVLVWVLRKGL
jgi:hypothetical protein